MIPGFTFLLSISSIQTMEVFIRTEHFSAISSVIYNADGSTLALGSRDNTVKIWDTEKGELLHTLGDHNGGVISVTYSADGQTLASGSWDNTIKIWNAKTGELQRTISGHANDVTSVVFSTDGQVLASGSVDHTVKIWDAKTGELQRTLNGHTGNVTSVSYSFDGRFLASGSWDNTVKIWDAKTGELQRTISGHANVVTSVVFSTDDQTLASGSWDNTVKIWDAKTGELLHTLDKHHGSVTSISYSVDGLTIASGSSDHTIKIWNAKTGKLYRNLNGHTGGVKSISYSADGQTLASVNLDNTVKLWDIYTEEVKSQYVNISNEEWLAFLTGNPKKLFYNASLKGDEYAAVRFDNKISSVYPLNYYRDELLHNNLSAALQGPKIQIHPKFFRLWWDRLKKAWLQVSGITLILLLIAGYAINSRRRSNLMNVVKNFFKRTNYLKLETRTENILIAYPRTGASQSIVALWEKQTVVDFETFTSVVGTLDLRGVKKLYWVYKDNAPDHEAITQLRKKVQWVIIPLSSPILERAISDDNCNETLKNLEEPYLVRIDPYAEAKPIHDPNWFYGRESYLGRLPELLTQGQHVGVFGLRKVGKTSLINQLRQRSVVMPTVFIDCQSISPDAVLILQEIQKQLLHELADLGIKKLPRQKEMATIEDFQKILSKLFDLWNVSGRTEPFLLILDEIDKLFPNRDIRDSEQTLHEYVRLFKVIRGLAQSQRSLVILAVAYRPDINRHNYLSGSVGENPMFKSYHEEYLGFLNAEESYKMIVEIGKWKDITWEQDAAHRVFAICGGHPLITRYFASYASERGNLKNIDLYRVEQSARELEKTLRKNDIGNYYKEAVWALLLQAEQTVLQQVCQNTEQETLETEISVELEEALTNLEQFGVIKNHDGKIQCTGELFEHWLKRNLSS